jgi:hypothetical protein
MLTRLREKEGDRLHMNIKCNHDNNIITRKGKKE